jgi:hypothetical protein
MEAVVFEVQLKGRVSETCETRRERGTDTRLAWYLVSGYGPDRRTWYTGYRENGSFSGPVAVTAWLRQTGKH